eukprot:COSAG02_NODE_49766_length_324_cov_23.808889_1_plen_53_part_10
MNHPLVRRAPAPAPAPAPNRLRDTLAPAVVLCCDRGFVRSAQQHVTTGLRLRV